MQDSALAAQILAAAAERTRDTTAEIAFPLSRREKLQGSELAAHDAAAAAVSQNGAGVRHVSRGCGQRGLLHFVILLSVLIRKIVYVFPLEAIYNGVNP